MKYLGVDVGGTNIAVGIVDENKNIIHKKTCKTKAPRPAENICDDIASLILLTLKNSSLKLDDIPFIGIGCPGTVNTKTGIVDYSTNLFLKNFELKNLMESRLNKKVIIENDANTAAYGEYIAGSALCAENVIVITLGTGVGSGIIINGKIYNGLGFEGSEIGHMVIKYGGRECSCSRRGCFETYSSARGLIRTAKEYMQKCNKEDTILWSMVEGDIKNVRGRTAFQAMRQGDKVGKAIIDEYIEYLACGLINVINIFQPELLCVGGGISRESKDLLPPLYEYIKKESYNRYSKKQTKLTSATLGNDAGIIGAAMIGFATLN